MSCKGLILAGGAGTRLHPTTKAVCKQLLPIYNKPLIYYPLSVLMLAGIKDILIITTPKDKIHFIDLLYDGSKYGINIRYATQDKPRGIAEAFIIGEKFIGDDEVCLILGDNIFFGHGLVDLLQRGLLPSFYNPGFEACIFAYHVNDPQRYGVVELDSYDQATSIEEKPKHPKSNWAITGLYFYKNNVIKVAKSIKPSKRGELEITDVNNFYLDKGKLRVIPMGRGYAWLDTGTHDSLLNASLFIKTIEERQGLRIGDIEEVAKNMGYIK